MKNKTTAGFLSIFLGGFGIHRFYLGHIWLGILYLAFSWTYIPSIVGVIEGIVFFTMHQEDFDARYNR